MEFKQARKNYLESVIRSSDKEEMLSLLPKYYQDNYLEIMKELEECLTDEIKTCTDLLLEGYDEDLERECTFLKNKLLILNEELEKYQQTKTDNLDESNNNVSSRRLIFGRNLYGNIPFIRDIERDIVPEYYDSILELLDYILNVNFNNNTEKVRMLSNNNKLKNIFEVKGFKTRIIFKYLPENNIYIEMVRVKKDNLSTKDVKEPEKRCNALEKDYWKVYEQIKEKRDLDNLFKQADEDLINIKNILTQSKDKGETKNGKSKN